MSYFGLMPSIFILLAMLSVATFFYIIASYIVKVGLLAFLPQELQEKLVTISFFDILVSVIIERKMSKLIVAVLSPFF